MDPSCPFRLLVELVFLLAPDQLLQTRSSMALISVQPPLPTYPGLCISYDFLRACATPRSHVPCRLPASAALCPSKSWSLCQSLEIMLSSLGFCTCRNPISARNRLTTCSHCTCHVVSYQLEPRETHCSCGQNKMRPSWLSPTLAAATSLSDVASATQPAALGAI